jgi:hypothetical protein
VEYLWDGRGGIVMHEEFFGNDEEQLPEASDSAGIVG